MIDYRKFAKIGFLLIFISEIVRIADRLMGGQTILEGSIKAQLMMIAVAIVAVAGEIQKK